LQRTLGIPYARIADPDNPIINRGMFMPPLPLEGKRPTAPPVLLI